MKAPVGQNPVWQTGPALLFSLGHVPVPLKERSHDPDRSSLFR